MFKAGLKRGVWHDEQRRRWQGEGPRPLSFTLFYPAPAVTEETMLYVPPKAPIFRIGQVAMDAPLSGKIEHFPVVVMSHGTGGSALGMGWLGCRLARAGYVVVGIDHHGNTALEPYLAEGFLCWWERARDLSVALNFLSEDPVFADRIDPARIYAAGFSLGGYTVAALAGARTNYQLFLDWYTKLPDAPCGPREFPDLGDHVIRLEQESAVFRQSWHQAGEDFSDPRIRASAIYAPAPTVRAFTADSLQQIKQPISIMCGQGDTEAPYRPCAQWLHNRLANSTLHTLGEDVGHYVFLTEATDEGRAREPLICADPAGVDRAVIHDQAAGMAADLFAKT